MAKKNNVTKFNTLLKIRNKIISYILAFKFLGVLSGISFFLLGEWSSLNYFSISTSILAICGLTCIAFSAALFNNFFDKKIDIFSRKPSMLVLRYISPKEMLCGSFVLILIGLVLVIIGLILSTIAIRLYFYSQPTTRWPSVLGEVISTKVKLVNNLGGTFYRSVVHYSYKIYGKEYFSYNIRRMNTRSTSYNPLNDSLSRNKAEMKIKEYTQGKSIEVYYNPNSSQEAVLEPGIYLSAIAIFLFVGIPLILLGIYLLIQ